MVEIKALASRLFREPLAGFSLVGGALFAVYFLIAEPQRQAIRIGEAAVEDLVQMRSELLGRSLREAERVTLLEEYVNSEILLREAVAQGLHLRDGVVRKRLLEKMNFLLGQEPPEPGAEDLQRLYEQNPRDYYSPRSLTFEHVYFKEDRQAAAALLATLDPGQPAAEDAGEIFWLGRRLEHYSAKQLVTLFGFRFERELRKLALGQWAGPIQSGRGWHLIRVEARHEPRPLPDEETQRRLRADWAARQRQQQRAARLAELRAGYQVLLPRAATGG